MATLAGGCVPVALSQVPHCAAFGQEVLATTPVGTLAHSGKNFLQKSWRLQIVKKRAIPTH